MFEEDIISFGPVLYIGIGGLGKPINICEVILFVFTGRMDAALLGLVKTAGFS